MNVRAITLTDDEAQQLEEIGTELLRSGDRRGLTLLAAHLRWRKSGQAVEPDTFSRRVSSASIGDDGSLRTFTLHQGGGAA